MKTNRSAPTSPSGLLPLIDDPAADPRINTFAAWLAANDRRDTARATRLAREMRQLGISVCLAARHLPKAGAR